MINLKLITALTVNLSCHRLADDLVVEQNGAAFKPPLTVYLAQSIIIKARRGRDFEEFPCLASYDPEIAGHCRPLTIAIDKDVRDPVVAGLLRNA